MEEGAACQSPCHIQLVETPNSCYVICRKDLSKYHPGGLKGQKIKPKVVYHQENMAASSGYSGSTRVCVFQMLQCTLSIFNLHDLPLKHAGFHGVRWAIILCQPLFPRSRSLLESLVTKPTTHLFRASLTSRLY